MAADDLHVKVQAHPAGYWFIIGAIALFGAMFLLAGYDRLTNLADAEAITKMLIGIAILFAAFRAYRYFTTPNVSVTDKAFIHRPFWRPARHWQFEDTEAFATYTAEVPVKVFTGTRFRDTGRVNIVQYLVRKPVSGEVAQTVLPRFLSNDEILAAIRRNSGMEVARLDGPGHVSEWAAS